MRGDSTDGNGRTEIDWGIVVVPRDIGRSAGISHSAPSGLRGRPRRHHGREAEKRLIRGQGDEESDGDKRRRRFPALVIINQRVRNYPEQQKAFEYRISNKQPRAAPTPPSPFQSGKLESLIIPLCSDVNMINARIQLSHLSKPLCFPLALQCLRGPPS